MSQNLISQTMTDVQRDAMLTDFDAFDTKFASYKCLLTPQQIRHLSKLDREDMGLLDVALTFAQQNPASIPAELSVAELVKDVALAKQLAQVDAKAQQKANLTECSLITTLSDAFAAARMIYRVEKAKGRTPANEAFLNAFGDHFGRGPQSPTPPPTP